jgi:hypothetical protein
MKRKNDDRVYPSAQTKTTECLTDAHQANDPPWIWELKKAGKKKLIEGSIDIFEDRRSKESRNKNLKKIEEDYQRQIGKMQMDIEWLKKNEATRTVDMRKLIDPDDKNMTISCQCQIIEISPSAYDYKPAPPKEKQLDIMDEIYDIYLDFPFYGSRKISEEVKLREWDVGKKQARSLMKKIGVEAIYQKPNTSKSHPEHKIYPYLLNDITINRPNQV